MKSYSKKRLNVDQRFMADGLTYIGCGVSVDERKESGDQ